MERYEVGKLLGEGAFSRVFYARKKSTGEEVRSNLGIQLAPPMLRCHPSLLLEASRQTLESVPLMGQDESHA